jgi:Leucine-rich repeat (LRR) protein
LRSLPKELGKLQNLRLLNIRDCNGLTRNLSPQIKALSRLETLKMTACEVEFLPKEIWELPSIQSLMMHSTTIPTLPDIGELRDINSIVLVLSLQINDLSAESGNVPRLLNIGTLRNLNEYRILLNCVSSMHVPDVIGSLVTLSTLKVSGNQLMDLPASIGDMKNLTELWIRRCGSLGCIPTEIWKLRKLKTLHITDCKLLTVLPNEIGFLSALRTLNIRECGLERLPPTVGALEQLERLTLKDNSSLQSIPKEIGMLNNLQSLLIEDCESLTVLPDEIGQLSRLQVLKLYECARLERLHHGRIATFILSRTSRVS